MASLTHQRLLELLSYDSQSGIMTWRVSASSRARAGDEAGYADPKGYRRIRFAGRNYLTHRLAWLYVHGVWPDGEIDHADGNPSNNAIANLRLAGSSQNKWNSCIKSNNTSGLKGVEWDRRRGRWRSKIQANGKRYWLGYFDTPQAAQRAYVAAAKRFHGEYANTGAKP